MAPQRTALSEFSHLRPVASPLALDDASLEPFPRPVPPAPAPGAQRHLPAGRHRQHPVLRGQRLALHHQRRRRRPRAGAGLRQRRRVRRRDGPVRLRQRPPGAAAHAHALRAGRAQLRARCTSCSLTTLADECPKHPVRDRRAAVQAPARHQPQGHAPGLPGRHRPHHPHPERPVPRNRMRSAIRRARRSASRARSWRASSAARARWPAACSSSCRSTASCTPAARPSWSTARAEAGRMARSRTRPGAGPALIRPATPEDGFGLSELLGTLGYPCPPEEASQRVIDLRERRQPDAVGRRPAMARWLGMVCCDLSATTCRWARSPAGSRRSR